MGRSSITNHPYSMAGWERFSRGLVDAIDKGYRSGQIEVEDV